MLLQTFPNGYLHMSRYPVGAIADEVCWIDNPVNAALLVVQALLLLFVLRDLLATYRQLGQCFFRSRFLVSLEHNMGQARVRDKVALCCLPAIVMILHAGVIPTLHYWQIVTLLAGFFSVRYLLYAVIPHKKVGSESWSAIRNTLNLYLLAIFTLWAVTVALGASGLFSSSLQQILLLSELGLVLLLVYISQFTILALRCGSFKAFLYLCALEIIPATGTVGVALIIS